jgi:hypothetical protein
MLEDLFPNLHGKVYQVTSAKSWSYNCVAWAAGDVTNRWWPSEDDRDYWPAGVPCAELLSAFRDAFSTMGYVECDHEDREDGMEKVAIFADPRGTPLHMARQLASGRWTSKLGALEDIEHDLRDLEGEQYGQIVLIMKRPFPPERESPRQPEG